jgi:hypothetical protein
MPCNARAIAFYLPQYHPIPENDRFWGKGFTEWTNVTSAKPLFRGHKQPFLPSDLGFYDLRVAEVRNQQANLAKEAGIEGFCYWHYWFGNGQRALESILDDVIATGLPKYPFCVGWANESWTGKWHGLDNEILFEQTYPSTDDYVAHFETVLLFFQDPRYICVDGKPVFLIYRPDLMPSFPEFRAVWDERATNAGLPGIHWISNGSKSEKSYVKMGFDGYVPNNLSSIIDQSRQRKYALLRRLRQRILGPRPTILAYKEYVSYVINMSVGNSEYPVAYPNWDNTPRLGPRGYVLSNSDPSLFSQVLEYYVRQISNRPFSTRFVFIKSWNEWAEGNTLEPSVRHGSSYLSACADVLIGC